MAMHCVCGSSCVHPADVASQNVVQAVPSCYNILFADEETASATEEDSKESQAAACAGGITADVRWQAAQMITCHSSCPAPMRQSLCMILMSVCLVQGLSEDELGKVFKTGLHLPEWAMVRLVSKRWKAMADNCADCVNVGLTGAEWQEWLEAYQLKEHIMSADEPGAKAAFSRLCYAL